MKPATAYNLIFFTWPILAAFLLLFTFITGPGTRFWLVSVQTRAYGLVKVGALGICADDVCSGGGLGYDAGNKLGTIIPRFSGAAVFHLITFFIILISIGCHIYILPRLHDIRETLLAKALWIAPAFCALLLGICIVVDFALLGQLSSDPVVAEATQAERGQVSSSPVSPGGALFLPIPCLILCLVWIGVAVHFLRKSYATEEKRDEMERQKWQTEMEERKQAKEENPSAGYGCFNFGGKSAPQEGEQQAGGWGMPGFAKGWMGGGDKDDAPSSFYEEK